MAETEQVQPLSPAGTGNKDLAGSNKEDEIIINDDTAGNRRHRHRRRKFIIGFITVFILLHVVAIIVLIFTIFKVKDPVIILNSFTSQNNTNITNNSTMSIVADVSVKNPSYFSFKYSNTTTTLYHTGTVVGEARGPPGRATARRTVRMNVSMDFMLDRLTSAPNFSEELVSGKLGMSSYSRVPGRVKFLVFKKHLVVKMNCTMNYNVSGKAIQDLKCKKKVKL